MQLPLTDKEQVKSLIPQRDPIMMIERFIQSDAQSSVSELDVKEDNIFISDKGLMPSGLIENIAQTAAARAGYHYLIQNKPVPLGFIGAVQKFKLHNMPVVGDKLSTTVTILNEIMNVSVILGEVKVGEVLAATCEMKIFIDETKH